MFYALTKIEEAGERENAKFFQLQKYELIAGILLDRIWENAAKCEGAKVLSKNREL